MATRANRGIAHCIAVIAVLLHSCLSVLLPGLLPQKHSIVFGSKLYEITQTSAAHRHNSSLCACFQLVTAAGKKHSWVAVAQAAAAAAHLWIMGSLLHTTSVKAEQHTAVLAHPLWHHGKDHEVTPLVPVGEVAKHLPDLLWACFYLNFRMNTIAQKVHESHCSVTAVSTAEARLLYRVSSWVLEEGT